MNCRSGALEEPLTDGAGCPSSHTPRKQSADGARVLHPACEGKFLTEQSLPREHTGTRTKEPFRWFKNWPSDMECKQKKEGDHSRQVGGRFNKQRNMLMRLVSDAAR